MTPFLEPSWELSVMTTGLTRSFRADVATLVPVTQHVSGHEPEHRVRTVRDQVPHVLQTLSHPTLDPVCPGHLCSGITAVFIIPRLLPNDPVMRTIGELRSRGAYLEPGRHGQDHCRPDPDVWAGGILLDQYGAFWMRLLRGRSGRLILPVSHAGEHS